MTVSCFIDSDGNGKTGTTNISNTYIVRVLCRTTRLASNPSTLRTGNRGHSRCENGDPSAMQNGSFGGKMVLFRQLVHPNMDVARRGGNLSET